MAVERFLKRQVATAAQVEAGGLHTGHTGAADFDRWPAVIVPTTGTYQLYASSTDGFDTAVAAVDDTDEVWYPETTPTASATELVIGRDFDIAVFQSTAKNAVFRLEVPAPVLTISSPINPALTTDVPMTWTSAFNVATKIYRTALFTTANPTPSDFDLIAEVDAVTTPAVDGAYTDSVPTAATGQSVAYFVQNDNGISSTVKVDFITP